MSSEAWDIVSHFLSSPLSVSSLFIPIYQNNIIFLVSEDVEYLGEKEFILPFKYPDGLTQLNLVNLESFHIIYESFTAAKMPSSHFCLKPIIFPKCDSLC